MNELVKALQSRIADLEQGRARYENARIILAIEVDYWRGRALGTYPNYHPDSELGKLLACIAANAPEQLSAEAHHK